MIGKKRQPAPVCADPFTGAVRSPGALLTQLAGEYPELSLATVSLALEQAYVAAAGLGPVAADHSGGRRVAVLARDRLDVARARANLAARRVGRGRPVALPAGF